VNRQNGNGSPLLRETSVKPSRHAYDHRTAVLLFDKDGRRIASVYFDQFGTGGSINGESGTISGGVYSLGEDLAEGCRRIVGEISPGYTQLPRASNSPSRQCNLLRLVRKVQFKRLHVI